MGRIMYNGGYYSKKKEISTTQMLVIGGIILAVVAGLGKLIWWWNTGWTDVEVDDYTVIAQHTSYMVADYSGTEMDYEGGLSSWSDTEVASEKATLRFVNEIGYSPEIPPTFNGMVNSDFDRFRKVYNSSYSIDGAYGVEKLYVKGNFHKFLNRRLANQKIYARFHYGSFSTYELTKLDIK